MIPHGIGRSAVSDPSLPSSAGRRAVRVRLPTLLAVVLGLLLAGALAWTGGLIWYAAAIPQGDRSALPTMHRPDAVVVLTGGSERVREGLALLESGLDADLFISGVPAPVAPDDLWRVLGLTPSPVVADRVVLGHVAADTAGNAAETAAWVQAHGYRTVLLVTAAYHMRRALLEFRHTMPDVRLIPHPVYPPHVKQEEWWRFPGTAGLLAREYTKYLVAWLRITLGLAQPALSMGDHVNG